MFFCMWFGAKAFKISDKTCDLLHLDMETWCVLGKGTLVLEAVLQVVFAR